MFHAADWDLSMPVRRIRRGKAYIVANIGLCELNVVFGSIPSGLRSIHTGRLSESAGGVFT